MKVWITILLLGITLTLSAQNQPQSKPCESPESRQFDFWVGEWEIVKNGTTEPAGISSVQLILGNCIVFENYTNKAYAGKSFNIYNAGMKKWQQFWVDNQGQSSQFVGEFQNGEMRFTGESLNPNGQKTIHRMTFTPMSGGRVRQFLEDSKDNGKTWTTSYDGIYMKKK
jgi:hypothetical protein